MAFQNALTVGTDYSSTRNITGTGTELDPWYVYEIQDFLDAVYTQGSYVVLGADMDFKSSIEYRAGIPSTLTIKTRELYGRAYPYKSTKTYAVGDKVSYDNGAQILEYTCTQACTGVDPTDTDYWTYGNIQAYDDTASYSIGECCIFNNGLANTVYICTDPCTGINPNNTAHWEMKNFLDKKISGLIGGNITGYSDTSVVSTVSTLSGTSGYLYLYNIWFKDIVLYRKTYADSIIAASQSKNAYWYNCKFSGLSIFNNAGGCMLGGNGTFYMYYCSGYFKYSKPTIIHNSSLLSLNNSGNRNVHAYDSFFIIDGLHCQTDGGNNNTPNIFLELQNSTVILDLHVGRNPAYSYEYVPILSHTGAAWTNVIFICHLSYYQGDGGEQPSVYKLNHGSSSASTRVFTDSSLFGDMFELVDTASTPIIQLTTEQLKDKDVLAEHGLLVNEVVD